MKLLATTALIAFSAMSAQAATLIGDEVQFECTNCGPPTNDVFIVTAGLGPELSLFNQFTVDVEANTLRIDWIFSSVGIISNLNFLWSDLDLGTGITNATIDASSTWGLDGILNFTDSTVDFVNNGDSTVAVGDYLLINLTSDMAPVPLPATLPLLAAGLLGAGIYGRRRKS